jgi:hypothetical protein
MPFGHVVVAVALKFTGEPTVLLFAGEVTDTPEDAPDCTVMVTGLVVAPPQLSHSSTTVSYVAGLKVNVVFMLSPFTTYASTPGAV